jgi:hypothetical protein
MGKHHMVDAVDTENSICHILPLQRLRLFENRVLKRIFVPKRDEETGGWRKLQNEELQV